MVLLAMLLGAGAADCQDRATAQGGKKIMSEQPTGLTAPNLPDAAYFSLAPDRLGELTARLADAGGAGIVIGAPKTVDTRTQARLPVLLATRFDGGRNWDVKADINTILVVTDLDSGRVHVAKPFVGEKRLSEQAASRVGPPPQGADLEAMHTSVELLDARPAFKSPWRRSRLALTVLIHDWRSNTVLTNLAGEDGPTAFQRGGAAADDDEPRPWLRQDAVVADRAPPSPIPGVAITVTPTGGPTGGAVAWCRIRLGPMPAARLQASLLLVKKDASGLRLLPLEVNSTQAGASVREATFAVDLQGAFEGELDGEFIVYLIAYDQLAGPAQVRF